MEMNALSSHQTPLDAFLAHLLLISKLRVKEVKRLFIPVIGRGKTEPFQNIVNRFDNVGAKCLELN